MTAALAVLWKLLKVAIPVPLIAIVAVAAWAHFDKASAVRRAVDDAVERLVHSAEKEALAAKLEEERRLRAAGELAIAGYTRALAEADARDRAEDEKREQEIADYERRLAETGRSCGLDDADREWLLKP